VSENKHKHLEFIQAIIVRLSTHSFVLKGWAVTLVAALFALSAKDANPDYMIIAYLPALVFWLLDAYFLSRERSFRDLYDSVRGKDDEAINYSMDARSFIKGRNTWPATFFSLTLLLFYLPLVGMMLIVMYYIT
jgi:hypothetical protein